MFILQVERMFRIMLLLGLPLVAMVSSVSAEPAETKTTVDEPATAEKTNTVPLPPTDELMRGAPGNLIGGGTRGGPVEEKCTKEQTDKGKCQETKQITE